MNIVLLADGELFIPSSDERAQHIRKILHMKEGDSFRAGIINGDIGKARILSDTEEGISLDFIPEYDGSRLYPLTLIVAQVRPICMRRILREAVSIGIGRLILPVSDLGEKSYLSASLYKDDEYKDILLDGAMQSGQTGVSRTDLAGSVEEAISLLPASGRRILLDNAISAVALSSMKLEGESAVLAIGPERGWSDRERKLFIDSGFEPALLGSRILRTETAVPAASAVALSLMGYI